MPNDNPRMAMQEFEYLLSTMEQGNAMLSSLPMTEAGEPLPPGVLKRLRDRLKQLTSPDHDAFVVKDHHIDGTKTPRERKDGSSLRRDIHLAPGFVTKNGIDPWYMPVTRHFERKSDTTAEYEWYFDNGWRDDLQYHELWWDGRLLCRYPIARNKEEWLAGERDYEVHFATGEEAETLLDELLELQLVPEE